MVDALQGIGAVVSTQLLSRGITFLLNVLIARLASPTAYGLGYVSLQLLSNLVLFITKEGFRKVALRLPQDGETTGAEDSKLQSSANLGWAGAAFGLVVAGPLAFYWLHFAPATAPQSYNAAVLLTVFAAIVEGVAEPFLILTLAAQDFSSRAVGEAGAIFARTIGMLLLTLVWDDVPLAFAASQLLYSVVWLCWFARRQLLVGHAQEPAPWKPALLRGGELMLRHHRALLVEFAGMVLLKLALTEGEKMLLLALFSEQQWGVFGLVSNLGSIVLRLLFAPTEEIAYSTFSASAGSQELEASSKRKSQLAMLRALLLLQGGVGWLGLCFGPSFSGLAVRLLYGKDWAASEAPSVLAAYSVLLFCMALNGILEAFMYSQCAPSWVRMCNFWQVGISLVLLGSAWAGRSAGPTGLVAANCLAMLLRALLGAVFVRSHLAPSLAELRLLPVAKLLGLLALGAALCSVFVPNVSGSSASLPLPWPRVGLAVTAAAASIATAGLLCRGEVRATISEVRRRKDK